jgi:mono/diheme cytochrome c family protein
MLARRLLFFPGVNYAPAMRAVFFIWLLLLAVSLPAAEKEPMLMIGGKTYGISELLRRPELESITVKKDPAYGGNEQSYQAIRAAILFGETKLREDEVVQVRCLDGFVASISKERMMGNGAGHSVAYIAIEEPKSKWPSMPSKPGSGSAGPFYLVWLRPEVSGILQEEWPYQVAAFEVKGTLKELYPRIFPKHEDPKVVRGLKLFQQTCFACHTINQQGPSQVGPDLNLPLNPTEYLKESVLPLYIRDPKAIRSWEGSKMPGFDLATLSDEDIANIVSYLTEMAAEKAHSN